MLHSNGKHSGFVVVDVIVALMEVCDDIEVVEEEALDEIWELKFLNRKSLYHYLSLGDMHPLLLLTSVKQGEI